MIHPTTSPRKLIGMLALAGMLLFVSTPPRSAAQSVDDMPADLEDAGLDSDNAAQPAAMFELDELEIDNDFDEAEVLGLMANIYRSQAEILSAHARGDSASIEKMIDEAVEDLLRLSRAPGVDTLARYRELFRSVVSEYEAVYGPVDSLAPQLGSIFGFRARMFASINDLSEPLLEHVSSLPEMGPVQTTVPMTMNRLVEASLIYLMREPEKHVHGWMKRADTYLPMIEEIFAEEGVPDELKYLAMVESGLNPRARSWARAVGMWQFISATGRHYGLRSDAWVDDRMDPEKSTRAAARHLKDLYKMFGDWHLALAGYNYSPGKLRRHLRNAERRLGRKATFWDVYRNIPRETRNYVPMFIATSLMLSQPELFRIEKSGDGPIYEYHHVPVYGMLRLSEVADMAGTNTATIRALNPELRKGTLPPSRTPYWVRIPYGSYDDFAEAYRALPQSRRQPLDQHVVRRGETLGQIANRYGVSWRQLMSRNGLRSSRIRVGQRLAVPLRDYGSESGGEDLTETGGLTVRYGLRMTRPIAAPQQADIPSAAARLVERSQEEKTRTATRRAASRAAAEAEKKSRTRIVYTVRKGDTLGAIGEKYGVTARQLRRWNNIRGSKIRIGQKLYLYVESDATQPQTSSTYTVRRGDNLAEIAARHGVTVASLRKWNGLSGSVIHPGQKLVVKGGDAQQASVITYRVRRGDNLSRIAAKFGVTVAQLRAWNNLRSSRILIGQRLKIQS